jgi:hypothetical protein
MNARRSAKPKPAAVHLHVEETQWQRRREYGECTAALVMNPEANGAEGLFNQALSNGLAAIVSHHWPGGERKSNGRMKSAADLLAFINRKIRRRGSMRVLEGRTQGYRWRTALATNVLADGVKRTDPVRHGTEGGSPPEGRHIDALVKLDTHPSLRSMRDALRDESWVRMVAADRVLESERLPTLRSSQKRSGRGGRIRTMWRATSRSTRRNETWRLERTYAPCVSLRPSLLRKPTHSALGLERGPAELAAIRGLSRWLRTRPWTRRLSMRWGRTTESARPSTAHRPSLLGLPLEPRKCQGNASLVDANAADDR